MNRKTIGALLVFLVLLGVVYFLQKRPEKGERRGERPRPLAKLDAKQIKQVTITAKGNTVALQRGDKDAWKLVKPVDFPADSYATKSMMEKLEGLEFGDLVTELKNKHAELQVDEKSGIHVVVSDGAKQVADFFLGKVVEGFTMFRLAGKDQVYQAVGGLNYHFEREVKAWRLRSIIEFKQPEARRLEVTTTVEPGAGAVVLTRPDEKTPWKVEQSSTPIDNLDPATVNGLLSSMASLSAFDFADDATPEKAGLTAPAATVTAKLASNKEHVLLVGGGKGDDYWVQRKGNPQIFVVKKYTIDSLVRRPVDFRDKSVLSFKAEDLVSWAISNQKDNNSVTLTREGEGWLGDGKKVNDAQKIKTALETLSGLKAEGFARHDAKELGLDQPGWVLELKLKDRSTIRLTVGSVEKDGVYGVQRQGVPEIFSLRKYVLDRFLLDPKSYK